MENSLENKIARDEPEILSFLELMSKEFPKIPWDVEGIFESGTVNMISAPPNQYKSWLVLHMAICLAEGTEVFERFKTKPQSILIVNEEDNQRMIKDRSLKMTSEIKDLGIHFMVMTGFKVDEDSITDILLEAEYRNITFVVFDSLRSIHSANENDSKEMQEIMDCFKVLTKNGITVLFTHHHRKKAFGKSKDDSGEESRGSTAINAGVHGHISCEEIFKEDGKYLLISQRKLKCDEKLKPFLLKIEADKENNRMGFRYVGEYDAKEETFRKNKEFALRFIEKNDQWVSKKEIAVFMGVSESTLSKVLQELENKEKLIQSKTTKDLKRLNIPVSDTEAKHNAKFYFRKDNIELNNLVAELPADEDF